MSETVPDTCIKMFHAVKHTITAISLAFLLQGVSLAYTPENTLLKVKGYSPEVVDSANQQRSRQEWKSPSVPQRTVKEKLLHNFYYGDWTDGIDDFGAQVIREH